MKDSIQRPGNEVAIVIYDAPLPPKYFRISKSFIRTLLITVPVLIVLIIGALTIWGLGSRIKQTPAPTLPVVISEADNKVLTLEAQIQELQDSNNVLSEKLATVPATASADEPYLMSIRKPYGMQNLLGQNKITLDQLEMINDGSKVNLKFQLVSSNPESKVSGHILVFMLSNSGLLAYPAVANESLGQGIKYSTGEPFSFSRLRPTNAHFLTNPTGETVKFVIYIFNREGDLLLIKETQTFQLGTKK